MTIDQEAKTLLLREEIITYHDNGKIKERYYIINNKLNGEYKEWREDGQLSRQGFYKNGKLNDEYKTWDIYGDVLIHEIYKDGVRIRNLEE